MKSRPNPFSSSYSRRDFLRIGGVAFSAAALARFTSLPLSAATPDSLEGRIFKTLKIGMVQVPGTLVEKFQVVRDVGFHGIELDSPGVTVEETKHAIAETGLPVDGTVCSTHWRVRHSDPDPEVRARALEDLRTAIRQTHAIGAHSVLLVPGHGNDGSEQEVWERSVENIRHALPLAAELGVYIAIENVWNRFLYDHDGPEDQTADKLRDYVDEFNSPWVGVQFDIGNHQKYGPPAEWIRTLGKRIVKLDVKDWGKAKGWASIGEGDVDWPAVRQALHEIGYSGWAAAEVRGGGREELLKISEQMDAVFGLAGQR
jgi:L-ribulose-5-phosphate 3-epimerase